MENFIIENPTALHFGKGVTDKLGATIKKYGQKVLLVYGGGSIKKNGIYEKVLTQLHESGVEIVEYSGIKPNPLVEDVNTAAELGRKENVDVILAVGGGSVIDSAKIIALTIPCDDTAWRIMIKLAKPKTALPIISVLTLAATGTEMNPYAVLQNVNTHKKIGFGHNLIYPRHSFLDPEFTYSVPKDYTAYGISDLIAHALENYFGNGEATLADRFVYAVIKEAVVYGPALLDDLNNYELRAKIMYAATNALNGLTMYGRVSGDWGVHDLGHILSLLYDSPHGATLSVVYPAWLKHHKNKIGDRISEFGKAVFNTDTAYETISALESFFQLIDCPVRMQQLKIGEDKRDEIVSMMVKNKVNGAFHKLTDKNIPALVDLMYNG